MDAWGTEPAWSSGALPTRLMTGGGCITLCGGGGPLSIDPSIPWGYMGGGLFGGGLMGGGRFGGGMLMWGGGADMLRGGCWYGGG